MLLSRQQKELILQILRKEKRSLFSNNKGPLLDKTIEDFAQMLRNEKINDPDEKY